MLAPLSRQRVANTAIAFQPSGARNPAIITIPTLKTPIALFTVLETIPVDIMAGGSGLTHPQCQTQKGWSWEGCCQEGWRQ